MKRLVLLCLLVLNAFCVVQAQDNNDFKNRFNSFKKERTKEFSDFRDKANADFAKFLEKSWKKFDAHKPKPAPVDIILPEPVVFDPVEDIDHEPVTVKVPIIDLDPVEDLPDEIITDKDIETQPTPIVKPLEMPKPQPEPISEPEPAIEQPEPISEPEPAIEQPEPSQEPVAEQPVPTQEPEQEPEPTPEPKPEPIVKPVVQGQNDRIVNYFSEDIFVPWNYKKTPSLSGVNEKAFAKYWKQLSENSKFTIDYLSEYGKNQGLNGWGFYCLVRKVSEAIYPESQVDNRIALQVYLLSQLGFRAKAAVCGERLVLLLPFSQKVYSVSYLKIDGTDYFIYSYGHDNSKGYRTYSKDFAAADQNLNLSMSKAVNIGKTIEVNMPLWGDILGEKFNARISQGQVNFEFDYPIVDPEIFYNQEVPEELSKVVLPKLREKIKGMNEEESVSYLLNLVQNGFEYITDDEAFGRQKQLFIEESFYYGRNNCKDRVNIFSWLVRELVGLDVVYVFYDGTPKSGGVAHIACAVAFNSEVYGDAYIVNDKRYVVCDPTYINAGIGLTMSYYDVENGKLKFYYNKN